MAATDAQIQAFFALAGETVTDAQLAKIKNWMVAVRGWTSNSRDADGDAISRPDSTTLVEMLYADLEGKVLHWQADTAAQTF
jgi:hypothetical protein